MSRVILGLLAATLSSLTSLGCTDLSEGTNPSAGNPAAAPSPATPNAPEASPFPERKTVLAPTGIASVGDVEAVQNATGGNSTRAPAANPQPTPTQPAQPEKRTGSILGKTTGKIVDLAEVRKNPKIVEYGSKVTGSDPLTVSFNAYVSITSRASVLNFKHNMDILKETNGGQYPSFQEAQKLMKECNIQLATLPAWQLYGYDAKTGGIVVLEDKGEKIRLYKAKNIPIEDADKPFDTP